MKNMITIVIDKRKCLCWPKGSLIIIPISLKLMIKIESYFLMFRAHQIILIAKHRRTFPS